IINLSSPFLEISRKPNFSKKETGRYHFGSVYPNATIPFPEKLLAISIAVDITLFATPLF
ncbi:MAG: hypothetical protein XD94_1681, partial [Mesotoga prima]